MITKIKAAYVVGFDGVGHEIITNGEVVYENDTILYVGKHYEEAVDRTEDMGNAVVMPGFIDLNALGDIDHDIIHLEVYPDVRKSLSPSEEYFDKGPHEWMTPEEEAFKSLFAYTQLIMNGVTTAMPITSTYYKRWADTYEEEEAGIHHAGKLGLRLYTSPSYQCGFNVVQPDGTMTVRFLEGEGEEGLERAVRFIRKYDGAYGGLIRGALLPERIEVQTEENLIRTKQYADDLECPIKLHAAQGLFEYRYIKEKTGLSPIEYLDGIHFLDDKVGIPHCYIVKGTRWVSDDGDDLGILARTKATAIYCPPSDEVWISGFIPRIPEFIRQCSHRNGYFSTGFLPEYSCCVHVCQDGERNGRRGFLRGYLQCGHTGRSAISGTSGSGTALQRRQGGSDRCGS